MPVYEAPNPPTPPPHPHKGLQQSPLLGVYLFFSLRLSPTPSDPSRHSPTPREDCGREVRYPTSCNLVHTDSYTQSRRRESGIGILDRKRAIHRCKSRTGGFVGLKGCIVAQLFEVGTMSTECRRPLGHSGDPRLTARFLVRPTILLAACN